MFGTEIGRKRKPCPKLEIKREQMHYCNPCAFWNNMLASAIIAGYYHEIDREREQWMRRADVIDTSWLVRDARIIIATYLSSEANAQFKFY